MTSERKALPNKNNAKATGEYWPLRRLSTLRRLHGVTIREQNEKLTAQNNRVLNMPIYDSQKSRNEAERRQRASSSSAAAAQSYNYDTAEANSARRQAALPTGYCTTAKRVMIAENNRDIDEIAVNELVEIVPETGRPCNTQGNQQPASAARSGYYCVTPLTTTDSRLQ